MHSNAHLIMTAHLHLVAMGSSGYGELTMCEDILNNKNTKLHLGMVEALCWSDQRQKRKR